jgi:hypothetical protein
MERITRKDAEQALRVYCERAGLPYGHYFGRVGDYPAVMEIEQNGRTFLAHEFQRNEPKDGGTAVYHGYVITGGLALSGAYGGWQVHQIIGLDGSDVNGDGLPCTGVRTPFGGGYGTAREIYTMLRGAIDGLELVERQADSNV